MDRRWPTPAGRSRAAAPLRPRPARASATRDKRSAVAAGRRRARSRPASGARCTPPPPPHAQHHNLTGRPPSPPPPTCRHGVQLALAAAPAAGTAAVLGVVAPAPRGGGQWRRPHPERERPARRLHRQRWGERGGAPPRADHVCRKRPRASTPRPWSRYGETSNKGRDGVWQPPTPKAPATGPFRWESLSPLFSFFWLILIPLGTPTTSERRR